MRYAATAAFSTITIRHKPFLIQITYDPQIQQWKNLVLDLDSVLPMVCRWRNTKALHLVKQGGAFQAESSRCSARASKLPIGALAGSENFSTHFIFQRRICNLWLWLHRCTALEWR